MTAMRPGIALSLLALCVMLSGCGGTLLSETPAEITVFAASSLKDAFISMAKSAEGQRISKVEYNFAGSQALVAQLTQGARADVFAAADAKNMESAIIAGVVATGTQRVLVTNRLAVAVPPGRNPKVAALNDLAEDGVKLVLADRSVPAGNYSLQMLNKLSADPDYGAGFKERVLANVVSYENNVRQVVAKVELGEADAGVVYITDIKGSSAQEVEIPDQYNVTARYYIAPVKGAQQPDAARFIDYALSEDGQRTLESYGFGRAESGK